MEIERLQLSGILYQGTKEETWADVVLGVKLNQKFAEQNGVISPTIWITYKNKDKEPYVDLADEGISMGIIFSQEDLDCITEFLIKEKIPDKIDWKKVGPIVCNSN